MPNQFSPSYLNRQQAKLNGIKTYEGAPCKNCKTTTKQTSHSGCARCHRERNLPKLYNGIMNKYQSKENNRARLNRWRKNNPEKVKSQRQRVKAYQNNYQGGRRAKIKSFLLTTNDRIAMRLIYEQARILTHLNESPYEVDHITPIARGGVHHPNNLQILTRAENRKKGAQCVSL